MRTPGADIELTAGFLFSERVVRSADELSTLEHCRTGDEHPDNVTNATLVGAAFERLEATLADRQIGRAHV